MPVIPTIQLCGLCIASGALLGLLWWFPMMHFHVWVYVLTGAVAGFGALMAWVFA